MQLEREDFLEDIVFCNYVLDDSRSMKERYYGVYYAFFCIRTKGNPSYCLYNLNEEDIKTAEEEEKYSDFFQFVKNRIWILLLIMAVQIEEIKQFMYMVRENMGCTDK